MNTNMILLFLFTSSIYYFTFYYHFHHPLSQDSSFASVYPILRFRTKPISHKLSSLSFTPDRIYHHDGIAYDFYSQNDLRRSSASQQWKTWSLPSSVTHRDISPTMMTKLPFVDVIYVITDRRLTQRHQNLIKALSRQGIDQETINWRWKWNHTTCNSNESHSFVYQKLNLKDKPLNVEQQKRCAVTMEHVDVWYEMAEQNVSLGLIVEDDAIFVPFFKEKFTRMIFAAIEKGILHLNDSCVKAKEKPISNDEQIHQNPMIVIGTCSNFHGSNFASNSMNATPVFSTHKSNPSRCTHAYLLTSCSAQALVDQIQSEKNAFWPSDFMQNHLFARSPTLQSFWVDPPLSYQGNQVIDLDNIQTFREQTYMTKN